MSNRLSSLLKKKLFGGKRNLVSLEEPYAVMARLLKGSAVTGILDAGASNGHISQRLLSWFPQATACAFEPNPLYVQTLQDLNRRDPRVRPQFAALSDRVGRERLHIMGSPLYSEIDAFLRTQGFTLYDIYKPKYDPHGLLVWADAIFLNLGKVPLQKI